MVDANETKRYKARQLRYRKAIVKDVNLSSIKEDLPICFLRKRGLCR